MSKLIQKVKRGISGDLRFQFAHPSKSLVGYLATKRWDKENQPVAERVVSKLKLNKDSKALEIGFGRGHGISLCHSIIKEGKGLVFGIERSSYMSEKAFDRFYDEITKDKSVTIDTVPLLNNMPYPTKFFDAVFHIDVFYFWRTANMRELCSEFHRILTPGGRLVCGMELNRLRRLEKLGVLAEHQYDPLRYVLHLEPAGFQDVKIEYEKIDGDREIQIISAKKSDKDTTSDDFDAQMSKLEKTVKQDLAIKSLLETQRANSELIKEANQQRTKDEPTEKTQQANQ
ncbi:Methyltransferase type 11 domain containing protein [Aphelenchoides bicaudatus]|nr:Methyltransferase type 11 domain containing protein [Aphelenchoides bicaudatus]